MHAITCRKPDTLRILEDYIPTTLFAIGRNVALGNILKDFLMEVSNVIVVRLVTLAENFIFYNLLDLYLWGIIDFCFGLTG